ncbi:MAG: WecB/TagA/CpsF family glycosyltransferase, partial [Muribaculaceae bacterium]|nr:WecB/TagA/CpsF family glycosyltransferase [Muribaculaceae bacterium]
MTKTDVMGVAFDNITMDEAVSRGMALAREGQGAYAVTPNPEIVLLAQKDPVYGDILAGAALTLPDGIGIIYAAKLLKRPLRGRVPGIDFASGLLKELAEAGLKLYLLGAKPGVAERAAEKLRKTYPGLRICGTRDGYFQNDGPVVEDIKAAGADV